MNNMTKQLDFKDLAQKIKDWATELGFEQIGITDTDLNTYEQHLLSWLENNYHGEMAYMAKHGTKRSRPSQLIPGTHRIITARINYLAANTQAISTLQNNQKAYISRYALGGDYHKYIRKRLNQLAEKIQEEIGDFGYRAFADSAPVLEKPLAEKAGLGWIGKNTMLINRGAGSWFFLGVLYTDLPLPVDNTTESDHCGNCKACISICPTQAIVGPYKLDARRCISYLTIELKGSIPIELRPLMGNRIYGCDDCQLICPWNRYAKATDKQQFQPRHGLANADLIELFNWSEEAFLQKTQGSAIRRIGYECWLRNIAVALGNATSSDAIITALNNRLAQASPLVKEHIEWALEQHKSKQVVDNKNALKMSAKLNVLYE